MKSVDKTLRIVSTDGHGLLAIIELDGQLLGVMDNFSMIPTPTTHLEIEVPEFGYLDSDYEQTWEDMFSGNPNRERRLVPTGDWSYTGYGQIVAIEPVVADFGVLELEVGDLTHDERCVGEWIRLKIARLDLTFRTG